MSECCVFESEILMILNRATNTAVDSAPHYLNPGLQSPLPLYFTPPLQEHPLLGELCPHP